MRVHSRFIIAASIVALTNAAAQAPAAGRPALLVRVHVADSAGVPVAGADITVMRGLAETLAHTETDARGDGSLSVAKSAGDDELVVRKIGYQRVSRFFADSATTAPLSFAISLARSVQTLETVKVSAQEDVRRKSYFIGADDIEHSPRLVDDALDIVMKLRPDMIWGRAGEPDRIDQHVTSMGAAQRRSPGRVVRQAQKYGYCTPVQNVWVNGALVRGVSIDPMAALKRVGNGLFINMGIATILGSIKPEHIAEIEYHPCTDTEGDAPVRSNNAIMVTLKEGIKFEPGVGSFLATGAPPFRAGTVALTPRVLGVFDEVSGDPVAGVDVVDVATGTVARTTATGTVALNFLPAGEWQVKITRTGYTPVTMHVTMSPRDTTPITVVLVPTPK